MSTTGKPIEERDYYTAISHFYRGELGRIMVWRQRLDTTTNWAIISSTGIVSFALGHKDVPHIIFMMANIMIFLLLIIEGRRYRYYDAFRARVRMLEAHFLAPTLMRQHETLEGDWRKLMVEDLLIPSFKIGACEAVARRLKRNYIWIFLILVITWLLRIYLDGVEQHVFATHGLTPFLTTFIQFAQDSQPFFPWFFWGSLAAFYGAIAWLTFYSQKDRYASGEMEGRMFSKKTWKI